jgi:hypothetical protein
MPHHSNPAGLKNLKPAKKGEVRNPLGINRKRPFTDRISQHSEELLSASKEGEQIRRALNLAPDATFADAAVKRLMRKAIQGDVKAFDQMANRIEGKPAQRIDLQANQTIETILKVEFVKRLKSVE